MADSLATITETLQDNLGFEANDSLAEAKIVLTKANEWLLLSPASASDEGSSLSLSTGAVERIRDRAANFIAAKTTTAANARTRFLSMENFSR